MEFSQKKNREIDLFDFTTFFGLDFFTISGSDSYTLLLLHYHSNFRTRMTYLYFCLPELPYLRKVSHKPLDLQKDKSM